MGHTIVPFTWQYQREKIYFSKFRRALLRVEDKRVFDDLWNKAEFHIPAAEKASHPLPISTVLMMMNLEQEKTVQQLENKINTQAQMIERLEKALKKSKTQSAHLSDKLETIEADIESRLKTFREEILEIKYPEYAHAP